MLRGIEWRCWLAPSGAVVARVLATSLVVLGVTSWAQSRGWGAPWASCARSSGVRVAQRWPVPAHRRARSVNVRQMVGCCPWGWTPVTVQGYPCSSKTVSPVWRAPMVVQPAGVGMGVSLARSFPVPISMVSIAPGLGLMNSSALSWCCQESGLLVISLVLWCGFGPLGTCCSYLVGVLPLGAGVLRAPACSPATRPGDGGGRRAVLRCGMARGVKRPLHRWFCGVLPRWRPLCRARLGGPGWWRSVGWCDRVGGRTPGPPWWGRFRPFWPQEGAPAWELVCMCAGALNWLLFWWCGRSPPAR